MPRQPDSFYVPDRRRYPARPIVARFATVDVCADALRTEPRTVHRWLEEGLSVKNADRIAVEMGMHPSDLWPDWFDNELEDTARLPQHVEQTSLLEGA